MADGFTSRANTVSPLAASPDGSTTGANGANGFTAVNPKVPKPTDDTRPRSQHHDEAPRRGNVAAEAQHQRNGGDNLRNGSPLSSSAKRKRSISNDESDSDSDDHHDGQSHYSRQPPGDSWHGNGRPGDDQIETRVVEALGRDRQQSANGHGSMEGDSVHGGPARGYQQDEYTGMITTNAGVQMDPKKRKRVRQTSPRGRIFQDCGIERPGASKRSRQDRSKCIELSIFA
jgi:hypothetical protein